MFKEAFKKSLENAELLQAEQIQINEVFQELTSQILEASNGQITLSIRTKFPKQHPFTRVDMFNGRRESYIVAHSKTEERQLCEYKDTNGGFPVNIRYQETDSTAYDKESLVLIIKGLLESTHAGLIFKSLLRDKK